MNEKQYIRKLRTEMQINKSVTDDDILMIFSSMRDYMLNAMLNGYTVYNKGRYHQYALKLIEKPNKIDVNRHFSHPSINSFMTTVDDKRTHFGKRYGYSFIPSKKIADKIKEVVSTSEFLKLVTI